MSTELVDDEYTHYSIANIDKLDEQAKKWRFLSRRLGVGAYGFSFNFPDGFKYDIYATSLQNLERALMVQKEWEEKHKR